MINHVFIILFASTMTELTTEKIKALAPKVAGNNTAFYIVLYLVALFYAIATGANIWALFGVPCTIPYVDVVTTSFICSMSASAIYDLLDKLNGYGGTESGGVG